MKINMLDCGRIILIFGVFLAFSQEMWYIDNGFDLSLSIFYIPIIIIILGLVIIFLNGGSDD